MITNILFYLHSTALLIFGVVLSAVFAGVDLTRKNILWCLGCSALSGALQIVFLVTMGETAVWNLYPLITHLPLLILLSVVFGKKWFSAVCSICTAYLCCQPAKWFGTLVNYFTDSYTVEYVVRICVLALTAVVIIMQVGSTIAEIFARDRRTVLIFGITPVVYYIFDYVFGVYTGFWLAHDHLTIEFLPFFLSIVFFVFCIAYHTEYERKAEAQRKENIIGIMVEEQAKELKALEQANLEIKIIRHDLRLLLNNISVSIENNDTATAQKLISGYINSIDATKVVRYCENTTVNYVLSSFNRRCQSEGVQFNCQVELGEINCDEIMLTTILSNALDNAINAQKNLAHNRFVNLMLKMSGSHLLMSVKNPYSEAPVFVDGMPVSSREGHGYGTKSVEYLTHKMGGNCQFTVQNGLFVLQVIIP